MLAVLLLNSITRTKRRMTRKINISKATNVESKQVYTTDHVCCRTCLSTANLEPIFTSKDNEKKRSHQLHVVTGLKIKMDDGLSQKICRQCLNTVKAALQFRRKSRRAEKTLLESITAKRAKRKSKLPKKDVETDAKTKIEGDTYNMYVQIGYDELQNDTTYEDDLQEEPYHEDTVKDDNVKMGDDDQEVLVDANDELDANVDVEKPARGRKKRNTIPNAPSYNCTTCNKEFRLKATYKAHMRFHTNYCVCETCGKRCRNNNQLQEHKRARHGLGRIHKCAYCEYSSATKEALTIHERRHTGERPYVCDHCGATFHRRSNLVQHIAIHLPDKNFQCDLCPKRLKSKKFLQIHKHNAHTGKKYGYLCPVCEHSFEKPNKVRAHARRVHGMPDAQHGPIVRVQL